MSDSEAERLGRAYPGILFPELGKGGYTFFRRVIKENLKTGEPVFFNTGKLVYRYEHKPEHKSFMDGVQKVEGDDLHAEQALARINEGYKLEMGLKEVRDELAKGETKGWFGKWR